MNAKNEDGYFQRVRRLTPTRFWINNPTIAEATAALASGAVSCTTNPTYASKLLSSDTDSKRVRDAIKTYASKSADVDVIAAEVQRAVAKPIQELFLPLHWRSGGTEGFVSIQGDPIHETEAASIVRSALEDRRLGENVIAKIPVTAAGIEAIKELVGENVPVIATEVMSISQAAAICEAYQQAAESCGHHPAFYVTHITGIFDEYLAKVVRERGVSIERDVLWAAGAAVARKQYRVMKERGYPGILLGGGARELHHFTEFVGKDVHITINWTGTAKTLLEQDPPVIARFDCPIPDTFVDELWEKIPEFRAAYGSHGLEPRDFADFGPVAHFRDSFVRGWKLLCDSITGTK